MKLLSRSSRFHLNYSLRRRVMISTWSAWTSISRIRMSKSNLRSQSTIKSKNSASKIHHDHEEKKLEKRVTLLDELTWRAIRAESHVVASDVIIARNAIISLTIHSDDERSCQRCIKRDLQSVCHDEMKKKDKHLHNISIEFFMSSMSVREVSNRFSYVTNLTRDSSLNHETAYVIASMNDDDAFSLVMSTTFSMYALDASSSQMTLSLIDSVMSSSSYSAQISFTSLRFTSDFSHLASSMQSMIEVLHQIFQITSITKDTYDFNCYDHNDSMQYYFYSIDFNFQNNFDVLKFDILCYMFSSVLKTSSTNVNRSLSMLEIRYDECLDESHEL
jgi:hypothetical protein